MSFRHYKSISNHYDKKYIEYFLKKFPEYINYKYIVQHKYDGANFQIIFRKQTTEEDKKEKTPLFASRNLILHPDDNFNNYKNVIIKSPYSEMMENIQNFLNDSPTLKSINLFGEIYGFLGRVRYHQPANPKEKDIRLVFFDVFFDNQVKSPKFFLEWAQKMSIPVVETFLIGSLDECRNFDVSTVKSALGDSIEGVVVKPYEITDDSPKEKRYNYEDEDDDEDTKMFYFKIKSEGFEEKSQKFSNLTKEPKEKSENTTKSRIEYMKYTNIDDFKNFLNPNRVKSALTKRSWTKKEMVPLADEILNDAFKDFKIDFPDSNATTDVLKKIHMNVIFKLIKEDEYFMSLN